MSTKDKLKLVAPTVLLLGLCLFGLWIGSQMIALGRPNESHDTRLKQWSQDVGVGRKPLSTSQAKELIELFRSSQSQQNSFYRSQGRIVRMFSLSIGLLCVWQLRVLWALSRTVPSSQLEASGRGDSPPPTTVVGSGDSSGSSA